MFTLADRVQETCAAPGTGIVTLLGAVTEYQSFSAGIGANNTTYYTIADQTGSNWEVGLGTIGATGLTLTRTTILASSNAGSIVNFSVGTQNIWCDYPAGKAVYGTGTTLVAPAGTLLPVANGGSGVGTSTGSGNNVLSTSPTLVTPLLGTPSSGTVTNLTGTASININGTVGATTASTGVFTTATANSFIPNLSTIPTNGVYLPATNSIGIATNSTNAVTIDASQNVGIGTSSPASYGKLAVNGTIAQIAAAGSYTIDTTGGATSIANAGTIDFAIASGMLIVNNYTSGAVTIYLCGGGNISAIANVGGVVGTFTYVPGINGYRWTNNTGSTATFGFFFARTRQGA